MKLRELLSIIEKISQEKGISSPKLCGGLVRDKVLKRISKINDLDITTGDETINYLAKEMFIYLGKQSHIDMKQAKDGHHSIFFGNIKLDFSSNFTLPNIDQILKTKHIINPTPLQKEVYSRDFTCNSLLMSLDLKHIMDPLHQGMKDIENKVIKTCLSPEITLTNSKNRVIRAIYLAVKLDFTIDHDIIDWVKKHPQSVQIGTEKTIKEKIDEALQYNPNRTVEFFDEMNLWQYLPITDNLYPYYAKRSLTLGKDV